MSNDEKYGVLLGDLRSALARVKATPGSYEDIVLSRDHVFAKYRPVFSSDRIASLSKEDFTSFLDPNENQHWSGLYRRSKHAVANMDTLRKGLATLLDESRPISLRFPEALNMVEGLGKALATAILTVAYPGVYGVWNNTSETALREAALWPPIEHGEGVGGRYAKVNGLLTRLKSDLGTDFWTLDMLWWNLLSQDDALPVEEPFQKLGAPPSKIAALSEGFSLERQLEEFLLENWDRTPLAKDWEIYGTDEEPEAGNQFPTDVGPVDILAVHRNQPRLLVVELKRNQSSDQTVGQVLRYIGGVKHRLKDLDKEGHSVQGLIIAHKADKRTAYALSSVDHVRMMIYEVEFRLKDLDDSPPT